MRDNILMLGNFGVQLISGLTGVEHEEVGAERTKLIGE